jgi:hypothetical protein
MRVGSGGYWLRSVDYGREDTDKGSCWNLNSGAFETFNTAGAIRMTPTSNSGLFQVIGKPDGGAEKVLMNVGNSAYFLQSADYVPNGSTGFHLDLVNGNMIGANFAITLTKGDNILTIGSKDCTNAIQISHKTQGEKFSIHWDGSVFLRGSASLTVESGSIQSGGIGDTKGKYYKFDHNGGTIAGWTIAEDGIYYGNKTNATSYLHSNGEIWLNTGGSFLELRNDHFKLSCDSGGDGYPYLWMGADYGRLQSSQATFYFGDGFAGSGSSGFQMSHTGGGDLRVGPGGCGMLLGDGYIKITDVAGGSIAALGYGPSVGVLVDNTAAMMTYVDGGSLIADSSTAMMTFSSGGWVGCSSTRAIMSYGSGGSRGEVIANGSKSEINYGNDSTINGRVRCTSDGVYITGTLHPLSGYDGYTGIVSVDSVEVGEDGLFSDITKQDWTFINGVLVAVD